MDIFQPGVAPAMAALDIGNHFSFLSSSIYCIQLEMSEKNQPGQCPSSQHVESPDPEKHQPEVVISQERQSAIRRKVHQSFITIYLTSTYY
jgi:hypothetical protein